MVRKGGGWRDLWRQNPLPETSKRRRPNGPVEAKGCREVPSKLNQAKIAAGREPQLRSHMDPRNQERSTPPQYSRPHRHPRCSTRGYCYCTPRCGSSNRSSL